MFEEVSGIEVGPPELAVDELQLMGPIDKVQVNSVLPTYFPKVKVCDTP